MSQNDANEKWQDLCDEFRAANDAYTQAFIVVQRKFAATADGLPVNGPTDQELSEYEERSRALDDVKERMDQFCRNNV